MTSAAYPLCMNTWQRLFTILMLFIQAVCEDPPVPAQQASQDATEQTQPPVEPITPPTPADATSDAPEQANEITGKVVGIIDGDTIDILTGDKTTIRIRLNGIDAPETGQAWGTVKENAASVNRRM